MEEPDHRHRRLLRPRRQRPCRRRAAEQRDELAPPDHSITSSARASRVGGTSSPRALGSLEVDDQLVLGRHLHRKVGRLLAFEDAIDVAGRAPIRVGGIRSVGHQPAAGCEEAVRIDCRQSMASSERDNQITLSDALPAGRHDQASIGPAYKCRDAAFDLLRVA